MPCTEAGKRPCIFGKRAATLFVNYSLGRGGRSLESERKIENSSLAYPDGSGESRY